MVVTNRRIDSNGTPDKFEPFEESERERQIKKLLELDEIDFVTVPNPYGS